jgi:hypothetical protein
MGSILLFKNRQTETVRLIFEKVISRLTGVLAIQKQPSDQKGHHYQ